MPDKFRQISCIHCSTLLLQRSCNHRRIMKKILILSSMLLLAACSSKSPQSLSGRGEVKIDTEVSTVELTLNDGVISEINIDEISEGKSKKELGDDYGMRKNSSIDKEWYEQIAYLEERLIGTDGQIKLDEKGKAVDADIISGCTIDLTAISEAINIAIDEAK